MSHSRDQNLAHMRDTLPGIWWSMYTGSRAAGFTDKQALALVSTFILSSNPYGIQPSNPASDAKDED